MREEGKDEEFWPGAGVSTNIKAQTGMGSDQRAAAAGIKGAGNVKPQSKPDQADGTKVGDDALPPSFFLCVHRWPSEWARACTLQTG